MSREENGLWSKFPGNLRHQLLSLFLPLLQALQDHAVQSWLHGRHGNASEEFLKMWRYINFQL